MIGLGSSIAKPGKIGKRIIRDGLVLKHDYNAGAVEPCSTGAAYFDDSANDYISIGNPANLNMGDGSFSVSCWARSIPGDHTTNADFVLGKADGAATAAGSDEGYGLYLGDGRTDWVFWVSDGTGAGKAQATVATNANQWYHLCGTFDGSRTVKLYVDGVLVNTGTAVNSGASAVDLGNIDVSNDFNIGRVASATSYDFAGYICNVGTWKGVVLTQPQVKSIMLKDYAALSSSEKTNLVGWWNLDETLGGSGGTSVVINNNDNTLGEELITGFTNGTTYPFDTFTSSGKNISAAVETSGDWGGCASNTLNLTKGEVYKCTFNLTYNSGDDTVRVLLASTNTGAATSVVDEIYYTNTNGVNEVYFRVKTTDSSSHLQLGTWHESDVINFSVTDISLKRVSGNTGTLS